MQQLQKTIINLEFQIEIKFESSELFSDNAFIVFLFFWKKSEIAE